jgi:integrase
VPLKLVPPRKGKSPNYTVRGTYLGVRLNRSTGTGERPLANKLLKKWEGEIERGELSGPDEATFASAAAAYMKSGGEKRFMTPLLQYFGERPLRSIGQAEIDNCAHHLYPNVSPATRNRQVYSPVSAVLKHIGVELTLKRPKGSQGNMQTGWLWPEEAERLFNAANELDTRFGALLITLCYTGMRLGEALSLTTDNVRLQDGYAFVARTKNEEPRPVHLPPVAVAAIASLSLRDSPAASRVFNFSKSGHLYSLLRAAAAKAQVSLPERSAFHLLRHTYATWMRRYAGLDTKGLVGTGAWKSEKSASRYSHTIVSEEARKADNLPVPKVVGK